jgi:hypothetical protein
MPVISLSRGKNQPDLTIPHRWYTGAQANSQLQPKEHYSPLPGICIRVSTFTLPGYGGK